MSLAEDRAANPTGFHRNTRLAFLGMGGWFRSETLAVSLGSAEGGRNGQYRKARRARDEGDRDEREREQYREHEREHEPHDDPAEHLEIERRRLAGGLPPTPELYALAREQWYRLPGALVRPSMDPPIGPPASGEVQPQGRTHPDEKGPER